MDQIRVEGGVLDGATLSSYLLHQSLDESSGELFGRFKIVWREGENQYVGKDIRLHPKIERDDEGNPIWVAEESS